MTVGQYQELYSIHKTETDDLERSILSVSVVTSKTRKELEEMPVGKFNALSRGINHDLRTLKLNTRPVSFLSTGGKLYQINYRISTLTAGQVIELNHWLKGDLVENMDKILASIAVPIKKYWWVKLPAKVRPAHNVIAEDMKDVKFADAYGCVVFFCSLFRASIIAILPYLEKEILKTGKTAQEIRQLREDLMNSLGGFTT